MDALKRRLLRLRGQWHEKPLRFRLTALLVATFLGVSTAATLVTAILLRDSYSQNVDNQLSTLADGVVTATEHGAADLPPDRWVLSAPSLYVGLFTGSYTSTGAQPVLPDPLPRTPFYETVYSADGTSGPYRVYGEPTHGGRTVVVATSLAGLRHTGQLIAIVVSADGVAALLLMALLSSYIVRRELRPLARVAQQADRLAASVHTDTGPPIRLDVPEYPRSTELGRMVAALDGMLAELRDALAKRDASEDRLRQFAADASHELRTPLQSIRGYAELRTTGVMRDGPEVDEAMSRITAEVRRMTGLVEALLALARFDAEAPRQAYREVVDLSVLVTAACQDAAAVQPARPITADVAQRVRVSGDPDQLARLLANLLGNVRMHTPEGAPVEVRLETTRSEAVLTVRDYGPGIPEDAIARVFDRFYRVDKGRSRAAGGSGLGLSIVAATVAAHQGRVRLGAPRDGGAGLNVTVYLPLIINPP